MDVEIKLSRVHAEMLQLALNDSAAVQLFGHYYATGALDEIKRQLSEQLSKQED